MGVIMNCLFYSHHLDLIATMVYEKGVYKLKTDEVIFTYASFGEFQQTDWEYIGIWN